MGKIRIDRNREELFHDLERYREKAKEFGASKVTIVKAEQIPVSNRVPLKCRVPICFGYGVCTHCPPNTLKPPELREILKDCSWGLFFIKETAVSILLRDKTDKERIASYQSIFKIVRQIEAMAFYDGHYLTFGFGAGSCLRTFCGPHENCRALEGKGCRFPLLARPSMEAVGIDVYRMVAAAGWDMYPIGSHAKPEDAPKGTLAGIVIV